MPLNRNKTCNNKCSKVAPLRVPRRNHLFRLTFSKLLSTSSVRHCQRMKQKTDKYVFLVSHYTSFQIIAPLSSSWEWTIIILLSSLIWLFFFSSPLFPAVNHKTGFCFILRVFFFFVTSTCLKVDKNKAAVWWSQQEEQTPGWGCTVRYQYHCMVDTQHWSFFFILYFYRFLGNRFAFVFVPNDLVHDTVTQKHQFE